MAVGCLNRRLDPIRSLRQRADSRHCVNYHPLFSTYPLHISLCEPTSLQSFPSPPPTQSLSQSSGKVPLSGGKLAPVRSCTQVAKWMVRSPTLLPPTCLTYTTSIQFAAPLHCLRSSTHSGCTSSKGSCSPASVSSTSTAGLGKRRGLTSRRGRLSASR